MAVIKLTKLGGIYPAILPRNLVEDGAQFSENLLARTSEFRPLATDLTVATSGISNPKSIYRLARNADGTINTNIATGWRASAFVINLAKANINDNKTERVGYTYGDGSNRPGVIDATGEDRVMGIPAPTVAPTLVRNEVYTFTPQLKVTEKAAAIREATHLVKLNATPSLVGVDSFLPATGWIRESDFSTEPDAEKNILRIFAVDPTTRAVIDTYSDMAEADAAWIFDPALGGHYSSAPGGYTLPAWATGHSLWWVIKLRGFARAYDITEATLATALETIDMPGTQGATPYLTSGEATTVAARIGTAFDKDQVPVKSLTDTLLARQLTVANNFARGGELSVVQATKDFYSKADVTATILAAKQAYAEQIWRYAEMIGTATATPFYIEQP